MLSKSTYRSKKYFFHFVVITVSVSGISFFYYYKMSSLASLSSGWNWLYNLGIFEISNKSHGILFSVPIIYSALFFRWKGAVLAWVLSLILILPRLIYFSQGVSVIATSIIYLFTPCAIAGLISIQLNWREKQRALMREKVAQQKEFTLEIIRTQEEERSRIARELHDSTLQTLLVIATRADTLHERLLNTLDKQDANWIKNTTLNVANELRELSVNSTPFLLDHVGLMGALRNLAGELKDNGINIDVQINCPVDFLPQEVKLNILRIVQEAFNNVRRHSRATHVSLRLNLFEGEITLAILDDGCGFDVPGELAFFREAKKLGLAGLEQRVHSLNGILQIDSKPGLGTTLSVQFKNLQL